MTSKRANEINNSAATRYIPRVKPIPSDPNELPGFLHLMQIEPSALHIMPLEEYQTKYEPLCYDKLPLEPPTVKPSRDIYIEIRNIVLTIILKDKETNELFVLPLKHLRKMFAHLGVTYYRKKFSGVLVPFAEPFNLSLFIFERGQIDLKGGNSLIQSYLAAEFILWHLSENKNYRDRFYVDSCSIKNIVSTSVFDFAPSTHELAHSTKNPNFAIHPNQKFPGVHVRFTDPVNTHSNIGFLVFDKPNVICVGSNRYENMRVAFEEFYTLARSLPPYDPTAAANSPHKKKPTKKRKRSTDDNTTTTTKPRHSPANKKQKLSSKK